MLSVGSKEGVGSGSSERRILDWTVPVIDDPEEVLARGRNGRIPDAIPEATDGGRVLGRGWGWRVRRSGADITMVTGSGEGGECGSFAR